MDESAFKTFVTLPELTVQVVEVIRKKRDISNKINALRAKKPVKELRVAATDVDKAIGKIIGVHPHEVHILLDTLKASVDVTDLLVDLFSTLKVMADRETLERISAFRSSMSEHERLVESYKNNEQIELDQLEQELKTIDATDGQIIRKSAVDYLYHTFQHISDGKLDNAFAQKLSAACSNLMKVVPHSYHNPEPSTVSVSLNEHCRLDYYEDKILNMGLGQARAIHEWALSAAKKAGMNIDMQSVSAFLNEIRNYR